jgi:hypothetical protein
MKAERIAAKIEALGVPTEVVCDQDYWDGDDFIMLGEKNGPRVPVHPYSNQIEATSVNGEIFEYNNNLGLQKLVNDFKCGKLMKR